MTKTEQLLGLCGDILDECRLINDQLEGYFNDPEYDIPSRVVVFYVGDFTCNKINKEKREEQVYAIL